MRLARISHGYIVGAALFTLYGGSAWASPGLFERECRDPNVPLAAGETRCNDGFFIRASGYASLAQAYIRKVQVDGSESYEQRVNARGTAMGFDFALGGTPMKGLLVGAFFGVAQMSRFNYSDAEGGTGQPGVTYKSQGQGQPLTRFTLGPAIAIFPIPARGWVLDVKPAIGGFSLGEPFKIEAASYGLQLGIGYELWVTPNFGVGLSLRGDFAWVRETLAIQRGPDYTDGTFRSVGIAITTTMH